MMDKVEDEGDGVYDQLLTLLGPRKRKKRPRKQHEANRQHSDETQPVSDQHEPPTELGQPPTELGQPLTELGQPPTELGQPLTEHGQPPTELGQPLTELGQPPTELGQPLTEHGQPPTEHGQPLTELGQPLTEHGQPLTEHGQPLTELGHTLGNRVVDQMSECGDGDTGELSDGDSEMSDNGEPSEMVDKDSVKDPFRQHFDLELSPEEVESLQSTSCPLPDPSLWPPLGLVSQRPGLSPSVPPSPCFSLSQLCVKSRLIQNWNGLKKSDQLTDLQCHLLPVIASYKDLLFSQRSEVNCNDLRRLYILHILNHVLKTRSRVLKNNQKLLQASREGRHMEEPRDQGLTRPKVLILLPFRHSALQVVETLISLLLSPGQGVVHNQRRFRREFGAEADQQSHVVTKPSSFTATFTGNTDDCFRLGVAVRGKMVQLFSDFYSSDIVVASPLGLRTVIGAEGEKKRDFDFLSSVEVLVLDQTDIFLMQNWEHLMHVLSHLHLRPREARGVDFSRVRLWALNEWSHLYRQTIIISSLLTPEINSLFTSHCLNYAGAVRCDVEMGEGSVGQVVKQLPQMFVRLSSSALSPSEVPSHRLQYFSSQVLPRYQGDLMKGTLIFIPSYFDFVQVRNFLKREELSFASINEYTTSPGVTRARTQLYQGIIHFLLYTERAHFFRRYRLRGVRHVVFYSVPTYPEYYQELVNMVEGEDGTAELLFCQWEQLALSRVVGGARARRMLASSDSTHMIVTGQ